MMIKYNEEFKATRVNVITFKGNFVVFISRNPKPDKEKHDFMFSINSFVVDYKHQTMPIFDVFMNILALSEFKGEIKIEFTNEKKLEENKGDYGIEIAKKIRNSILPVILNQEEGERFKNETFIDNSGNISQNISKFNGKFNLYSKKNGLKHEEMSLLSVNDLFLILFFLVILNKCINLC